MFPLFYQEILTGWGKYFSSPISIPSTITSQFLWFNKNFKIDGKCICFKEFSVNKLNFVTNLFESGGNIKPWFKSIEDFQLLKSEKFRWLQLIYALGTSWKILIKKEKENLITQSIYDHHLTKNN